MALDQIDKDILEILQENSKISHKEIAEQLNLTRTPIFERIKKMERLGIILKYVTLLNPKKINKSLTVFCYISLSKHGLEYVNDFQQKINGLKQVLECYHISGNFDFIMKVVAKDIEAYQKFVLKDLSDVKNIAHIQSTFVLGEIKHSHRYQLDEIL